MLKNQKWDVISYTSMIARQDAEYYFFSLVSILPIHTSGTCRVLIRTVHAKSLLAVMLPVPKGCFEQILVGFLRWLATVHAVDPKAVYLPGCPLLL